jgi:hypothetical protein
MNTHDFFTRNVLRYLHKHPALYRFGQTVREVHLHRITFIFAKLSYGVSPFFSKESTI